MEVAKGPSYWADRAAAEKAQRGYDDAVKYDRPDWKVREAAKERDKAAERLRQTERTGR